MSDNIEYWKLASGLVWPVIAIVVFFSLYNRISILFEREEISFEVAGLKVDTKTSTKKSGEEIAELQKRIALLEGRIEKANDVSEKSNVAIKARNILWLDDNPSNNAFLIDRLEKDGYSIKLAKSSDEAMSAMAAARFDGVITDLGRMENGVYKEYAGEEFVRELRKSNFPGFIFVYASKKAVEIAERLKSEGASAVANNPVDLMAFLYAQQLK